MPPVDEMTADVTPGGAGSSVPVTGKQEGKLPGIVTELGEMPGRSVIYEEGVAALFDRCETTVKRAVERGELPPPVRLFGSNAWTADALLAHIEARLERAALERKQIDAKIKTLSP
jgi:hypothetical protein